jgi:hypothetical protein
MFDFFFQGGAQFMTFVMLTGIAAIIWSLLTLIKFIKVGFVSKRHLDAILFLGSLSFFLGLLGQGIGLSAALDVIQTYPNISPAAIAGGIRVSMIAPITGAILFSISGIFWFILRYLNARKQEA